MLAAIAIPASAVAHTILKVIGYSTLLLAWLIKNCLFCKYQHLLMDGSSIPNIYNPGRRDSHTAM